MTQLWALSNPGQVGDRSGEPDPITLTAFGLNGEILGTSSFTSLYSGHFGQVSISVAGIHRVEFSDASPSGADFDDFNYHRLAAEITVAIDIKPGSFPNSINPKSQGTIPVAVLSAADFNAPQEVDPASLTFGRIGDEKSLVKVNNSSEDVNGDGLPDLVAHFDTQKTGFQPGDTEGILKGKTKAGIVLKGQDSVRVLGGS